MLKLFEMLKDWLNLGVVPLLGILILASLFIFLPDAALTALGLFELKSNYIVYFGLAFMFSLSFLLAATLNAIWKEGLGNLLKETARVHFLRKEAHNLTEEEKEILRKFIQGKTRSAPLSINNGVVLGLQKRMFIIRVGQLSTDSISLSFPFNIQPWAWEYLNKKPYLLDSQE